MIKRTIYVGNPAYLSLKNAQMILRRPDVEQDVSIPIEDMGLLVLDNQQITVTQGLMAQLLANNCAVVTCDNKCMPVGLLLPLDGHTLQSERFRAQIDSSKPLRKQLWQQTVQAKIANQATILHRLTGAEVGNMRAWVNAVRSGDADNLEARAAAYYWRNFFPDDQDFTRDRDGWPPNNLLNYGYAILRAIIARSLVGTGLLPTLGIHHHNKYNAYCLADDIMEPYRPFVDRLVKQMMGKYDDIWQLTTDMKRDLLAIPTLDVKINGRRSPLLIAATITTSSLAKCFAGETKTILYPVS